MFENNDVIINKLDFDSNKRLNLVISGILKKQNKLKILIDGNEAELISNDKLDYYYVYNRILNKNKNKNKK